MKTKTVELSVCKCGFPTLSESIPLGTEYEIDEQDIVPVIFRCGGCGATIRARAVWVGTRGEALSGYLPIGIFEFFQAP